MDKSFNEEMKITVNQKTQDEKIGQSNPKVNNNFSHEIFKNKESVNIFDDFNKNPLSVYSYNDPTLNNFPKNQNVLNTESINLRIDPINDKFDNIPSFMQFGKSQMNYDPSNLFEMLNENPPNEIVSKEISEAKITSTNPETSSERSTSFVKNRKYTKEPRVCRVCGRPFKYPSDLKKHEQIHSEEKQFLCIHCGRSFRRSHQLTVHVRIHTGEKPFVCNICGMSFRHDSTLTMHTRTRHQYLKPFKCDVCQKPFGRRSHLVKHQRYVCASSRTTKPKEPVDPKPQTPTVFQPCMCPSCNTIFFDESSWVQHNTNCNSKPNGSVPNPYYYLSNDIDNTFQHCNLCDITFESEFSLQQHTSINHPNYLNDQTETTLTQGFSQPPNSIVSNDSQFNKFNYTFSFDDDQQNNFISNTFDNLDFTATPSEFNNTSLHSMSQSKDTKIYDDTVDEEQNNYMSPFQRKKSS